MRSWHLRLLMVYLIDRLIRARRIKPPMLTIPSDQIYHYRQRAIECAHKACDAKTDADRLYFLTLERNWLSLARSHQLDDRIVDFTGHAKRRTNRWGSLEAGSRNPRDPGEIIVPFLIGKAFTPETLAELSRAFERACSLLNVVPCGSKAEEIARKIIELAQRGLRGVSPLASTAIQELSLRH